MNKYRDNFIIPNFFYPAILHYSLTILITFLCSSRLIFRFSLQQKAEKNLFMERTVPKTASEEIELYLRTIYSLLRTTTEIQIRTPGRDSCRNELIPAPPCPRDISRYVGLYLQPFTPSSLYYECKNPCTGAKCQCVFPSMDTKTLKNGSRFRPVPGEDAVILTGRKRWPVILPAGAILMTFSPC